MSRVSTILGVKINNLTEQEALVEIDKLIEKQKVSFIVKPNAEIVTYAQKDPNFKKILNHADLSLPDGVGLLLGSRLIGQPLLERFADVGLMTDILQLCNKKKQSIFLFGGKLSSVERLADIIKERYNGLDILGYQEGFDFDNDKLIQNLNRLQPDIIFVGLGFPKQEEWIWKARPELKKGLLVAEGGSFDFLSGEIKRAPVWVRRSGFEWFYRLLRQPWRIKRQLALFKFVYLIVRG